MATNCDLPWVTSMSRDSDSEWLQTLFAIHHDLLHASDLTKEIRLKLDFFPTHIFTDVGRADTNILPDRFGN